MIFSSRIPTSSLIELCRALRHNLSAGLSLRKVFEQQAKRGPQSVRPIAESISQKLEKGEALEDVLKEHQNAFPPLFLNLATIGEQSGMMPEIFGELEKYFSLQQSLRRDFIARITWPVIQLVAAIFVLAGLILIMGIIQSAGAQERGGLDPLGVGTGPGAAIRFLAVVAFIIVAGGTFYWVLTRKVLRKGGVEKVLLTQPVIGPCLHALALTRFCLALRLMMETGMSIVDAVRFSLRATDNRAYMSVSPEMEASLKGGDDLANAMGKARIFPEEFRNVIAVAEEGGRITDVLKHQTEYYEEEARRRMAILTQVASYCVWLTVATLIVVAIFRIFLFYVGMIEQNLPK